MAMYTRQSHTPHSANINYPTHTHTHTPHNANINYPPHTHTPHSAKTRDGVQEAFEELVHKILQTPSLYTVAGDGGGDGFNVAQSHDQTEGGWCACNLT